MTSQPVNTAVFPWHAGFRFEKHGRRYLLRPATQPMVAGVHKLMTIQADVRLRAAIPVAQVFSPRASPGIADTARAV